MKYQNLTVQPGSSELTIGTAIYNWVIPYTAVLGRFHGIRIVCVDKCRNE